MADARKRARRADPARSVERTSVAPRTTPSEPPTNTKSPTVTGAVGVLTLLSPMAWLWAARRRGRRNR